MSDSHTPAPRDSAPTSIVARAEAAPAAIYDAFISYSHAKDKPVASALQGVMQKLGKPWYRRRALRTFRDDTSLAAAPELWPAVEPRRACTALREAMSILDTLERTGTLSARQGHWPGLIREALDRLPADDDG